MTPVVHKQKIATAFILMVVQGRTVSEDASALNDWKASLPLCNRSKSRVATASSTSAMFKVTRVHALQ